MSQSIVIRPAGQTFALSVTGSQTADVNVTTSVNEQANYASCINSGAVDVFITFGPSSPTATTTPRITVPAAGAPSGGICHILKAGGVGGPILIGVPANGFNVSAIGAGAGPSTVFVTPVMSQ